MTGLPPGRRLKRDARVLKLKAISSLRRACEAFNSHTDDGRVTAVLLHLQHAFEMLLKAALVQSGLKLIDAKTGHSERFERCVNLARQHVPLLEEEASLLRAIDTLRDAEQHWYHIVSEGLLYAHARAAVTVFDDVLQRAFSEELVTSMPLRVLPLSSEPPRDIQLLLDEEYSQIAALLQPGKRRRHEAQARIRSLLAIESHLTEQPSTAPREVARVERAIRAGQERDAVFPNLRGLVSTVAGSGLQVTVRFGKAGLPVHFVAGDEVEGAVRVREVDLTVKYHWTPTTLAGKLGISTAQCVALRDHLGVELDPTCRHDFVHGKSRFPRYSDNAFRRLREALPEIDLAAIRAAYVAQKKGSCPA